MTVSKEEYENANQSCAQLSAIIERETLEYLQAGGLITRREKGGEYTYWGSDDGINFYEVKQETND